ncbi:hypothetical protein C8R45DRAFT_948067 [Mycena sanguinolenta]|nr:hypothetical protein C8R45DRAFT_948067 [Mycena sanguinolenta]
MGILARTYSDLGEYQKAKDLEAVVLEKRKQTLGDTHPDTLLAMGNLVTTYWHLKEYQKAADLEIIVLEKRNQIFGDSHPDTLLAMCNLAFTYSDLGEHQKAQELRDVYTSRTKGFETVLNGWVSKAPSATHQAIMVQTQAYLVAGT